MSNGDSYIAASEAINLATGTPATIGNSIVLDVTLTATGTNRISVNELGVSFNGVTATAVPVTVRLVRTTVAPVGGGTITQAPVPMDVAAPASTCTAYQPTTASPGVYATTAPTIGVILRTWYVSPTSGLVIQWPLGQEPTSAATAGAGFGIQCIAPATVQVNSYLMWTG